MLILINAPLYTGVATYQYLLDFPQFLDMVVDRPRSESGTHMKKLYYNKTTTQLYCQPNLEIVAGLLPRHALYTNTTQHHPIQHSFTVLARLGQLPLHQVLSATSVCQSSPARSWGAVTTSGGQAAPDVVSPVHLIAEEPVPIMPIVTPRWIAIVRMEGALRRLPDEHRAGPEGALGGLGGRPRRNGFRRPRLACLGILLLLNLAKKGSLLQGRPPFSADVLPRSLLFRRRNRLKCPTCIDMCSA